MKIALTGHKGFIGSHYYDYIKDHHEVNGYDYLSFHDLCDLETVSEMPDCDTVVHMAATNGTRLFYEAPTQVAINNTIPTINLINRYKDTDTKFVFTSSCEIFNGAIDSGVYPVPTDEKVPAYFEDVTNPRWSYSLPKALGENLVANSGLHYLIIRYFNVYGPRQKNHFIDEFVERVAHGDYYIKGNDTRSFCYIDDAIKLTHDLITHINNQIVNVGRQEETSVAEVARCIMDIMEVDPAKLEIEPGPRGSVSRRCPDTTKLLLMTEPIEYTSLKAGLKLTVEALL